MGRSAGDHSVAEPDWTRGPAKWGAVAVLGAASIFGMVWSMGRTARTEAVMVERDGSDAGAAGDGSGGATPGPAALEGFDAPAAAAAPKTPDAGTLTTRININTAARVELELLPGIGPALAGRIIDYRASHGDFKAVEELDRVKGIGPKLLEKLRGRVVVE